MSTLDLVDPELRPLLDLFPTGDLTAEALPAMRARHATAMLAPDGSGGVRCQERSCAGGEGAPDVRFLFYRPIAATWPLPVYLHMHGGGFVAGSPIGSDARNRALAATIGCAVASIEYRLAPDTPFPGALEDCYALLAWLANGGEGEVLADRIAVGGESAGAGLAAALALLARDRGGPAIVGQVLVTPMLDDRTGSTIEPDPYVGEFVWTTGSNRFGWGALLGEDPGGIGVSAYAAPARADDLARLPPAFIATGALDLFLSENIDYARRLLRARVPTELHVYPGAFHAFNLAAGATVSRRLAEDLQAALARFLAPRLAANC